MGKKVFFDILKLLRGVDMHYSSLPFQVVSDNFTNTELKLKIQKNDN